MSSKVVTEANSHIAYFTLMEEHLTAQRAKKCGCRQCVLDHEEAVERMNWATEPNPPVSRFLTDPSAHNPLRSGLDSSKIG